MGKKLQTKDNLEDLLSIVKGQLKEGEVYKNFKELCRKIGQPDDKKADSKKSQEAFFERCFDYHKIEGTQKIMIDKIYEEIAPDLNTSGMVLLFQRLFLSWIHATERYNDEFYIDDITLLSKLSFINEEYFRLRQNIYHAMYWNDQKEQDEYYAFVKYYDNLLKRKYCDRFITSLANRQIISIANIVYLVENERIDNKSVRLWTDILLDIAHHNYGCEISDCLSNSLISNSYWNDVEDEWLKRQTKYSTIPKKAWELGVTKFATELMLFEVEKNEIEIKLNHDLVNSLKHYFRNTKDFSKINDKILFGYNRNKELYPNIKQEIIDSEKELVEKRNQKRLKKCEIIPLDELKEMMLSN